jgi:hypothetical protein
MYSSKLHAIIHTVVFHVSHFTANPYYKLISKYESTLISDATHSTKISANSTKCETKEAESESLALNFFFVSYNNVTSSYFVLVSMYSNFCRGSQHKNTVVFAGKTWILTRPQSKFSRKPHSMNFLSKTGQ